MNKDYNFEQKNFAVIGASSGIGWLNSAQMF